MKKVTAIIQSRMGSTRLPGKVYKKICGKPILENIIALLFKCKNIGNIIVATTNKQEDNIICEIAKNMNVNFFRGNELNVLERYYNCACKYNAENIIRITGDNPIIDCKLIDDSIEEFFYENAEYYRNSNGLPLGMGIEIFTFNSLKKAYLNAEKEYEKEHVTPYMYDKNNNFHVLIKENKFDYSKYRVTVDTEEDFQLVQILYKNLSYEKSGFSLMQIVEFLKKNPKVIKINQNIKQKKLGD